MENRDIQTTDGQRLTMINPAYMTRQIDELAAETDGSLGHITSLNPIRPANGPDLWETIALQKFEQGAAEWSSLEAINGAQYMRLMKPLIIEEGCLQCHAKQGYAAGDVRGGLSVAVPMASLWETTRDTIATMVIAHAGLELTARIDLEVPAAIYGDSTCLQQILMNLLGNGLTFTPQGDVGVEVEVAAKIVTII